MKIIDNIFAALIPCLLTLTGCTLESDITNPFLRDRVAACSTGFSNDVAASLQIAYHKTTLKGGTSADFKNQTQSIIFSQLPIQDRLKAYEDYIQCIEQDWNTNTPYPTK